MVSKKRDKNSLRVEEAYAKLKKAYIELKDSHAEMVFKLALISEMRDRSTGVHLVRIADYSALIAEGLGLDQDEVEMIRMASPMHDIGKVMLPDSILKKDGALTKEEMEEVKKHPSVGSHIFAHAKTPMLKACNVIALTHHEKYDGTGYPKGLKGEQIKIEARIISVADAYAAMTNGRTYGHVLSSKEATAEIKRCMGTHFDPNVAKVFIEEVAPNI